MSLRQYVDRYSNWRVIHYGASKIDNVDAISSSSQLLAIYTPMEKRNMIFGHFWKIKQDDHYFTW
jgi:hypothetical protein